MYTQHIELLKYTVSIAHAVAALKSTTVTLVPVQLCSNEEGIVDELLVLNFKQQTLSINSHSSR